MTCPTCNYYGLGNYCPYCGQRFVRSKIPEVKQHQSTIADMRKRYEDAPSYACPEFYKTNYSEE